MSILGAHELLGHISSKSTIEIAKELDWNLFDDGNKYESCVIVKGIQKNAYKQSKHIVAEEFGENLFLDVAAMKEDSRVVNTTVGKIHYINQLHKVFGHCGLDTLKKTANMYDFKLSGKFEM
jgi:hypothetical protein